MADISLPFEAGRIERSQAETPAEFLETATASAKLAVEDNLAIQATDLAAAWKADNEAIAGQSTWLNMDQAKAQALEFGFPDLEIPSTGLSYGHLQILADRRAKRDKLEGIISRGSGIASLTGGVGGGLIDPTNLIPVVGVASEAKIMALASSRAASVAGRAEAKAAARLAVGAAEGAGGGFISGILQAGTKEALGEEYGTENLIADIGVGALMGAAIKPTLGALGDWALPALKKMVSSAKEKKAFLAKAAQAADDAKVVMDSPDKTDLATLKERSPDSFEGDVLTVHGEERLRSVRIVQAMGETESAAVLLRGGDVVTDNIGDAVANSAPLLRTMPAEVQTAFRQATEAAVTTRIEGRVDVDLPDGPTKLAAEAILQYGQKPATIERFAKSWIEAVANGYPDPVATAKAAAANPVGALEKIEAIPAATRQTAEQMALSSAIDGRAPQVEALVDNALGRAAPDAVVREVAESMDPVKSSPTAALEKDGSEYIAKQKTKKRGLTPIDMQDPAKVRQATDKLEAELFATLAKYEANLVPEAKLSEGAEIATESPTVAKVRESFGGFGSQLVDAGKVKIVKSAAEVPYPVKENFQGVHIDGVSYIREGLSPEKLRGVMLHEVGVHAGLEAMLGGESYKALLADIPARIQSDPAFREARLRVPMDTPDHLVAEETLAYLVENAKDHGFVREIIARVKAWARENLGINFKLTEEEAVALAEAAMRGQVGKAAQTGEMRYSSLPEKIDIDGVQRSTVNSAGRPLGRTEAEVRNFWNWFGDSKVVDARGRPLVMYHGTSAEVDFSAFDKSKMDKNSLFGPGVYTTASPDIAGGAIDGAVGYAGKGSGSAPRVMPVFAKLENPFDADDLPSDPVGVASEMDKVASKLFDDATYNEIDFDRIDRMELEQNIDNGILFQLLARAFSIDKKANAVAVLQAMGYDGVIHTGGLSAKWNPDVKTPHKVAITFDPTQIKSATGNRGTFDPTNPDIRYSEAIHDLDKADIRKLRPKMIDATEQAAEVIKTYVPAINAVAHEFFGNLAGVSRKDMRDVMLQNQPTMTASTADQLVNLVTEYGADEAARLIELGAELYRHRTAINAAKLLQAHDRIVGFGDSGKLRAEGLLSLAAGSELRKGLSRTSAESVYGSLQALHVSALEKELSTNDLHDLLKQKAFSTETAQALFLLQRKNPDMVGLAAMNPEAVKAAKILDAAQNASLEEVTVRGGYTEPLDGFISSQKWDMSKVRRAKVDKWIEFILPRLDHDKTFGGMDAAKKRVWLEEAYKTAAGDKDNIDETFFVSAGYKPQSLANLVEQIKRRKLHFKDGFAWHEAMEEFGRANNILESALSDIDGACRKAGSMEVLGATPGTNFRWLKDEALRSMPSGALREYNKELFGANDAFLANEMQLSGQSSTAVGSKLWFAKTMANARTWQLLSKLPGMLLSQPADMLNHGSYRSIIFGDAGGSRFFNTVSHALDAITKFGESKEIATAIGLAAQDFVRDSHASFDRTDSGRSLSSMMMLMNKLGLAEIWDQTNRSTAAGYIATRLAQSLKGSWDELRPQTKMMVEAYGIGAEDWPKLASSLTEMRGRTVLLPEPVSKLHGQDLALKVRTMLVDQTAQAMIKPGARERAILVGTSEKGDFGGEFRRCFAQLKSYPLSAARKGISSQVYWNGYDSWGEWAKAGPKGYVGLAEYITMSTALGYSSMALKAWAKGQYAPSLTEDERKKQDADKRFFFDIPVMNDKILMSAFMSGGGLGIYGDFLLSENNRYGGGILETAMGPTVGTALEVLKIQRRALEGSKDQPDGQPEKKDIAAQFVRLAKGNTPFVNHWATRYAMDRLVWFNLQEWTNPGSVDRWKRTEEAKGTKFFAGSSYQ